MKKEIPFHWDSPQEESFSKLKNILSSTPVLTFYDVKKPVIISCDASQSGLGALLLQDGKPVAYASRALSSAETRYAQIEKELLAVVFAFTKFHQYVYSKDVIVESDHKPLEAILKNLWLQHHQDYRECCCNCKSTHFHFTTNQAKK